MSYQALYRKWRPKVFEDVVGQHHIVGTIKNQIMSGKIAHAYLFCGSRGTGKTSTAKIFARAVNCLNPVEGNPCNECEACKGILNGSIFDVVEIDGASNNKVDDVRNIRDEVIYPPADIKYKVYIIDEVHMLTTEAFNALLKTLEEPPEYVIFILATTEFHKIPATIISRCQKFDFKRISFKDTARRIGEVAYNDGIEITPSAVNLLAKAADGSLRDGLSKLDQCMALGLNKIDYGDVAELIGASNPEYLADLSDCIIYERLPEALKLLDDGIGKGMDPIRLFSDLADYFRDIMMFKTSGNTELLSNAESDVVERYRTQSEGITLAKILKIIETLYEGSANAKYSASPRLALETAILKIASKETNGDIDSILERLEKLEDKIKKIEQGNIIINTPSEKTSGGKDAINNEVSENEIYEEIPKEIINNSVKSEKPDEIPQQNEEDIDSTANKINDNIADVLKCVKIKDLGFENIIKKAKIYGQGENVVFEISNQMFYEMAKKNNYDNIIRQAVSDYFGKEIKIILKCAETKDDKTDKNSVDPIDDFYMFSDNDQFEMTIEDK